MWSRHWPLGLMWFHAIFFLHFFYMPWVQFMPFGNYYFYNSLHSYIDLHIKYETLKTFSKLQLIFGCPRDFKYAMNVLKQSYEQPKHVYILNNVYYKYYNCKLHILEVFNLLHFSPCETHMVRLMAWWISLWTFSSPSHISYNIVSN